MKNKIFSILLLTTLFCHAMLLLNKHKIMITEHEGYSSEYTHWNGDYVFFDDIPLWTINIIYCIYFIFSVIIILGVYDMKEGFRIKKSSNG